MVLRSSALLRRWTDVKAQTALCDHTTIRRRILESLSLLAPLAHPPATFCPEPHIHKLNVSKKSCRAPLGIIQYWPHLWPDGKHEQGVRKQNRADYAPPTKSEKVGDSVVELPCPPQ